MTEISHSISSPQYPGIDNASGINRVPGSLQTASNNEPNTKEYKYMFKVITIGDSAVGKSNFIGRFIDDVFAFNTVSTIGISFKEKTVNYESEVVKIQIWDTAGQERFRSLTTNYFRNTHGVILMYDITNRPSFDNISSWFSTLSESVDIGNVPVILVGSKSDLKHLRAVPTEEGKQLANIIGCSFLETSALNSSNVTEIFTELVRQMIEINVRKNTITITKENHVPTGKLIDTRSQEQVINDSYGSDTNVIRANRSQVQPNTGDTRSNTVTVRLDVNVTRKNQSPGCAC